jgi:uncharacterized Zn finger protein
VDTRRIHRNTESGERGMTTISIRSFSDSTIHYDVTEASCECPHSRIQGAYCKHRILRGVILRIRKSPFGIRRDEEVAREIVARVLDRSNRLDASYEALSDARSFRYATRELVSVAKARHRENIRRELAKVEGRVA